jgi:hypothetical protein
MIDEIHVSLILLETDKNFKGILTILLLRSFDFMIIVLAPKILSVIPIFTENWINVRFRNNFL